MSDTDDSSAIRDGYKRTEKGIIPRDWDYVSIGDIAKVKGGKRLPFGFALVDTPTPHPYVRVTDMYPGGVNQMEIKYVPEEAFPAIQNYRIYSKDIFISVAGTLGVVGVVPPELSGANLTENADYITDLQCNRDYLKYCLMSQPIQKTIQLIQTTGAQPKLALGRIAKFFISIPKDIGEQHAIAEVLSDVDGLISALDALIAKKRAIKQATMQQLLTGETRLPGFNGEWETKQTGELIHLIPSGIYGLEKQTGQLIGMPVATTAHIDLNDRWNEKQMNIRYFTEGQVEHYSPLEGDLIVVKSSGSAASIQSGKVGYVSADKVRSFIFSNFLMLLRPTGCNAQFLFFQLTSGRVKQMLPQLVEASTYPNLRLNDYLEVQIPLPPEEEQLAIVNVLADIDAEIAALERRRDKSRVIKQGMMQQLLTGRVRLAKSDVVP